MSHFGSLTGWWTLWDCCLLSLHGPACSLSSACLFCCQSLPAGGGSDRRVLKWPQLPQAPCNSSMISTYHTAACGRGYSPAVSQARKLSHHRCHEHVPNPHRGEVAKPEIISSHVCPYKSCDPDALLSLFSKHLSVH